MVRPHIALIVICGCLNFIVLLGAVIGGAVTSSAQGKLTPIAETTIFAGLIGLSLDLCTLAAYLAYYYCHNLRHQQVNTIELNESELDESEPMPPPTADNTIELEAESRHLIYASAPIKIANDYSKSNQCKKKPA